MIAEREREMGEGRERERERTGWPLRDPRPRDPRPAARLYARGLRVRVRGRIVGRSDARSGHSAALPFQEERIRRWEAGWDRVRTASMMRCCAARLLNVISPCAGGSPRTGLLHDRRFQTTSLRTRKNTGSMRDETLTMNRKKENDIKIRPTKE